MKIRGKKLALEITLIIAVFFAVKTFMQRNLVDGSTPLVSGTLLDGQTVNLQSYKGKPVLLHFWATWCRVCKLGEDSIAAISRDYNVLTIAMNSGANSEIIAYLEKNNLEFPVLSDENGHIAREFGVRGVPTSFIIDPRGVIAFTEVGFTTEWGLRIRLWLAGN